MLKYIRQTVIQRLWENYYHVSKHAQLITTGLHKKGLNKLPLDHFAIIDLPSSKTGISHLNQLFSAIGYTVQGRDYLAEKQNDFLWLAEGDSVNSEAATVLPQVVVADFRLDELPIEVKKVIEKYGEQAAPSPLFEVQTLSGQAYLGNMDAATKISTRIIEYLTGRDWPLPSVQEFHTVREFNELLAWVLIFGRRPNHFTLGVHLLPLFNDLAHFHQFIENELHLPLNREGGFIKGGKAVGIAQSSTQGTPKTIALTDSNIELPGDFMEFVWRYSSHEKPQLWKDYFTGFIAQHADRVIESLYST